MDITTDPCMELITDCLSRLYITITPTDEGAKRLREEQCAAVSIHCLAGHGYLNDGRGGRIKAFKGKRIYMVDSTAMIDGTGITIPFAAAEELKKVAASVTMVMLPGQEDGDLVAWLNLPGNSYDAFIANCRTASAFSSPVPTVAAPETSATATICCNHDRYPGPPLTPSADRFPAGNHDIRVLCDLREENKDTWFRVVAFVDRDGNPKEVMIPMCWFSGGGAKVIKNLLGSGFEVPIGKKDREHLLYTLYSSPPDGPTQRLVSKIGWYGSSFILPNRIIGPDKELRFNGPRACTINQEGSLDDWKEKIGKYCIGNSRLALAVSFVFAGPLLQLLGMENGGAHFRGKNGKGKSTILFTATSVISGRWYCCSWRTTANGLEHLGERHNNLTLILDELGQLDPKEAGDAVYQLGNGVPKTRWTGNNFSPYSLAFLSSGEISLEEHIQTAGKRVMGGQKDRLVDIPAEPENGFGVYENLHEFTSGEALSDHLRLQTAHCYGTPLIAYLERLTQELEDSKEFVAEKMHEFHQTFVPDEDKANIARITRRFAVIAAAGELATRFGVTGWPAGEAMRCAGICFQAWFSATNGMPRHHYRDKLFAFLEAHGSMRFCTAGDNTADVANCAGFRRPTKDGGTEYFINPNTFRDEIFPGFISRRVCDELAAQGFLNTDKNSDHNTRVWTPPGSGKASRWFHVVIGESDTL